MPLKLLVRFSYQSWYISRKPTTFHNEDNSHPDSTERTSTKIDVRIRRSILPPSSTPSPLRVKHFYATYYSHLVLPLYLSPATLLEFPVSSLIYFKKPHIHFTKAYHLWTKVANLEINIHSRKIVFAPTLEIAQIL